MKKWLSNKWLTILLSTFAGMVLLAAASYGTNGQFCAKGFIGTCEASAVAVIEHPAKVQPKSLKGIYMTVETITSAYGKELIEKLVENGGNMIVLDIQHGGGLLAFNPKDETLRKINPGSGRLNDLPERIKELHKKGVYVIARQVAFNIPYVASKKPEWRIKNKWGGYYPEKWLDPSLPEVQDMNFSILRELAEMGFDEVQFDYVRFPAAYHNNYDYAYDETLFTRSEIIVDFLRKAKALASVYKMAIGADVFGVIVWGEVDWKIVGQDPGEIAKVIDAIYPMTYPSHFGNGFNGYKNPHNAPYDIVHDSIKKFVDKSGGNAEIRTWIQGFPLKVNSFGSWFMDEQVQAAFDAGTNDFVIWSPGNRYSYSWPSFKINAKEEVPVPLPTINPNL